MLSNYYCCCSPSTLTFSRRPSIRVNLHRSIVCTSTTSTTSSSISPSPPLQPHFMVDFLTTSCGFPLDKATKVTSKHFSHLKSTDKPNSFFTFMRSHGFNDTQIKKIISSCPNLLCSNVDKKIKKIMSLQDIGFSKPDIVQLICSNPTVLCSDIQKFVLPKIKFWESLLGSRDNLMTLLKKNLNWFLQSNPEKTAIPNISLLRDCGVSSERLSSMLSKCPSIVVRRSPEETSAAIDKLKTKLGVDPDSGMFLWALWWFLSVRESGFNAKLKFMMSFGWSEAEFLSAFCKAPNFVAYSEELLSEKMGFLLKEGGCEPSDVAHSPKLLVYSLERKLIPRHSVVKVLKSRGMIFRDCKMSTIMGYTNKQFMENYVTPYEEKLPEIRKLYMAACDPGGGL